MGKTSLTTAVSGWLRLWGCSICCLLLPVPLATAGTGALWQLPTGDPGSVSLYEEELETLRPGQEVTTRLPGGEIRWRITDTESFVNHDATIRAVALDGPDSLTVTWGARLLFATLERPGGIWQVEARRDSPQAPYRGALVEARPLPAHARLHDYVIPRRPDGVTSPASDLLVGGNSIAASRIGQTAASSDDGLRLDQQFDEAAVVAGGRMETRLTVTITNTGSTSRQLPDLDLFFLLEDMDVLTQPASCSREVERRVRAADQPVMRCRSEAALDGGDSRQFVFRVAAGPVSEPGTRLWSTALLDDMRNDAPINVVADVVSGSDGGESDFNLALMNAIDTDLRGDVVIDVLALYTPGAAQVYDGSVETRINQLVSVANRIYRDSGVGIRLRPVRHQSVAYPDDRDMERMLDDLTHATHPSLADVDALRAEWGGDLVILFRPRRGERDRCGLANLGGYRTAGDLTSFNDRDFAHSVVAVDCPVDSVVAHETGHNMGLTHSHPEDGRGGTFPYATGHGVNGRFVTVMADPAYFGGAPRLSRFSSPGLDCDGLPCGVPYNESGGADAVRTLNTVRFQVADFFPTRVPPLPARQVATADGSPTQARIAMAASTDGGRSFVQEVTAGERLDISAEFYVDEAHIGRPAEFHVMVGLNGRFMQLTDGGRHLVDWNGSLESLAPFASLAGLGEREVLIAVEQFQPTADLAGSQLQIYVAYRLLDSDELVFTQEPLQLRIRP